MMFSFIQTIVLDISWILYIASESSVAPFPAVFTLGYTGIYVCISNDSDEVAYIEVSVNKTFCFTTTLNIPNVYPNNCYIWLRWYFDYLMFRSKNHIVEYMWVFDNSFYYARIDWSVSVLYQVRDTVRSTVWSAYISPARCQS